MVASVFEAIAEAKRLLRTFASAPEPRRQARAIYAELTRAQGWDRRQRDEIDSLGAWLLELPPVGELRPRCEATIRFLAPSRRS
jgi:hypothetical protein